MEWYQKAYYGYNELYGSNHEDTLRICYKLGNCLRELELFEESIDWLTKAYYGFKKNFMEVRATVLDGLLVCLLEVSIVINYANTKRVICGSAEPSINVESNTTAKWLKPFRC